MRIFPLRWTCGLCLTLSLTGCLDDVLLDPHTSNQLVIWGDPLQEGRVGEPYRAEVGARVENTPYDDAYDVSFELVDSELPPGLAFYEESIDGNPRAVIRGTPEVAGTTALVLSAYSQDLAEEADQEAEEEAEDGWLLRWTNTNERSEANFILIIR